MFFKMYHFIIIINDSLKLNLGLELFNQTKNIPMVIPSSPIKIMSFYYTDKQRLPLYIY